MSDHRATKTQMGLTWLAVAVCLAFVQFVAGINVPTLLGISAASMGVVIGYSAITVASDTLTERGWPGWCTSLIRCSVGIVLGTMWGWACGRMLANGLGFE